MYPIKFIFELRIVILSDKAKENAPLGKIGGRIGGKIGRKIGGKQDAKENISGVEASNAAKKV